MLKSRVLYNHLLNGHEFEQSPGDSEGQGRLACCSPGNLKESDTTEQLNNTPTLISYLSLLSAQGIFAQDLTLKHTCTYTHTHTHNKHTK